MSSFPSGLFGNVLKNSELSQESLSRAAPQSRIHQAGVKAQFYDTYLQKLEETGNEKTALDEAQGIVDALEFEFQEKSQEIQHEARIMKTEDQGASKERDVGKQMENDNEDFFEDQSVKSDVPDGQTAMHKFSKLQSAMSRLSTMRKMFDKPQDPPEFSRIRVAHRQLLLAVNSYDDIMESAIQDKEAAIQRESAQKIRDTEVNLKRKLEFEYGSKIDHNNCNVHINSLTKELAVIKEELVKTTTSYSRQQTELQDLRIFKSNAEAEAKLLVNELAKRRAQCSVLRKRLAAINATVTVEQKVNAMKADETGLSCSEHQYNSDANKTGGGDTTEAGEGNDSSMDEQVSEYYANNGTKRPKWNPSTIAGSRTAEHFDAVSTKCHENYSEPKSFQVHSPSSIHHKYQKEMERMKRLLVHERKERKRLSQASSRKQVVCSHIGKVLQDCMQALDEQNNLITAHDDEDVCLDEETSHRKLSQRLALAEAIYSKKSYIEHLLDGLESSIPYHEADTDGWDSATERVTNQSLRRSRPSSAFTYRPVAPIIPVQLDKPKSNQKESTFISVKSWVNKLEQRPSKTASKHGATSSRLLKSEDKKGYPGQDEERSIRPNSAMRKARPASARTCISINSVRFAADFESTSERPAQRPFSAQHFHSAT